jgi:predicted nucleotidyltransferase
MTTHEQVLLELARALERQGVPYMVIGGHANALWGEPRSTLDIDVTVWLEDDRITELLEGLSPNFATLVTDAVEFVRETRVLPLEAEGGLRVDVIFGLLPFEENAIERAVPIEVRGQQVRFVTADDLILLKIVSTRDRDLEDVRGIVRRRLEKLDLEYLEPRIRELATLLDRPEILEVWESAKAG